MVGTGRSANVIWGALLLATLIAFATLALAATAAPAGAETTTQPPPSGEVVFQDTFDRDFDSSGSTGSSGGSNPTLVPPWSRVSAAAADRIVDDPLTRAGRSSAKFTVHKDDVNPLTYSENPRAQLNKNNLFCSGDDRYVGFSLFFPADRFPATLGQNWMILNSFGFGPPYGDAVESTSLSLWEDRIRFRHNSQTIWERPYVRGRWVDFVVHIKFSTDPGVGFMELWVDGQKQTLANGQTIRYYQTYDPDLTACGNMQPTQYRGSGFTGMDPVVLHQDEIKVGTSYEAVAP